jgi:predicted porin
MKGILGMTGGFKMTAGRLSLLAAAGFLLVGGASAQAADLGGDCCADLEERIAELEATTARKGNRKVSLTVYGHVNEAVMYWDDGHESNAYVVTNDNSRTRFGFKGDAKITDDWKAGFVLEIGVRGANSKRFTQDSTTGGTDETGLDVRHSRWFIQSKTFGTLSVGVTPTAAESATETNLALTKDVAKYADVEDTGLGLSLRTAGGGTSAVTWRRLIKHTGDQPGEGERRPGLWYSTPEFGGFNLEAGWGSDDYWDIGGKYKGEVGAFKVAAAIAYGENTTTDSEGAFFECLGTDVPGQPDAKCTQFGGSISVMHEPTGIYVNLAGGIHKDDTVAFDGDFAGTNVDDESTFWAIEAGIEKKWIPLGKTNFFGQYYKLEGGGSERLSVEGNGVDSDGNPVAIDPTNTLGGDANVFSTGLTMYGGGVVQELSAASMSLYLYYRHFEADLTLVDNGVTQAVTDLEDLDVVVGGAIIKF